MPASRSVVRDSAAASSRAAWLALLVAGCVTAAIVIAGDYHLFFVDFMFPTGDAASNDILITDAKRLALLHGNYSRVGFYHPGPFYLQWMAIFEVVFVDGLHVLASPFAAQLFALAVLHAGAMGLCFFAWLRMLERVWLAGLAAAMTAAVPLTVIGQNYFVVAWPPYMYVPSALIVTSSLLGLVSGDPRWLAVLLCGLLQLVHGHASFIGIAPAMMAIALATAVLLGAWPANARTMASLAALARTNRRLLFVSTAVIVAFALPIVANTALHWPGEIPNYFAFAGSPRTHGAYDGARYVMALVPGYGAWLLAFLLPISRSVVDVARAARLRAAGVMLAASAAIPAWLYAWRGVDTLDERYLIFWMLPFLGASLAAGVIYLASRLAALARVAVLGAAAIATAWGLAPFRTSGLEARRASISLETRLITDTVRAVTRENPRGGRLAVEIDPQAWTQAWPDVSALIAALHRRGIEDVCIGQASWHLLFHPRYRCPADNVSRLLYATTRERARPGSRWELPRSVIGRAKAPGIGTTAQGSALGGLGETGIVLFGDWSGPEEWGIWSNGRKAAFGFDASQMPARFHLEVAIRLFPPRELRPQGARVVDGFGRELATVSNADPSAPLVLAVDRAHDAGDVVMISFIVDSPVSPLDLGLSPDDRELGVGLETITIKD